MSLLPTLMDRDTGAQRQLVVHVEGSMDLADKRAAQFRGAYLNYATNIANPSGSPSSFATYTFPNGDVMRVQTHAGTDYVTIIVKDVPPDVHPEPLSGFLITLMKKDKNSGAVLPAPDYDSQRLYAFRFELTDFAYAKKNRLFAGNRRKRGADGKYFSWDGTGGGDIAHESFHKVRNSQDVENPSLQVPNGMAEPFAALSGTIYCDGAAFAVYSGKIYGMQVYGSRILFADFEDDVTVRIHVAHVRTFGGIVQQIAYTRALGTAKVEAKSIVNFSKRMEVNKATRAAKTKCVVLGTLVTIDTPDIDAKTAPLEVFTAVSIDGGDVVRSGFTLVGGADSVRFTAKKTSRIGEMTNFSPRSAAEYGRPDSESGPIVTSGHVEYRSAYFEGVYGAPLGDIPAWTALTTKHNVSTIYKQPMVTLIVGHIPTTVYAWQRTVSVTSVDESNILYWYHDFDTGSSVRLNWSVGYTSTTQVALFGTYPPEETGVSHGRGFTVGNVFLGNTATNWFYAVTNDLGDYVLRTAPNGHLSDALLVAKNGITRIVKDTYSVGII